MAENNFVKTLKDLMTEFKKDKAYLLQLKEVYIWGCGLLGKFAKEQFQMNNVKVLGMIDSDNKKWDGKTVFSPDILSESSIVIIASTATYDISQKLISMGVQRFAYYEEIPVLCKNYDFYNEMTYQGWFEEIEKNAESFQKMFKLMDDRSATIYSDVLRYRSSFNVEYSYRAYTESLKSGTEYYDDDIVILNQNEIFVDGGGYIGDTALEFIEKVNEKYQQIIVFEPNKGNAKEARKNLESYKNIELVEGGMGAKNSKMYFTDTNGNVNLSGQVSQDENGIAIDIYSLDEYIDVNNQPVPTFIKLDIEGSEKQAIIGMKEIIRKNKPMLAICAYHKINDFHELTDLILQYNNNYKIAFRHYSKQCSGSVLYFY